MEVFTETYTLAYQPTSIDLQLVRKRKKNVLNNILQPKLKPRQQLELHSSLPTTYSFVFEGAFRQRVLNLDQF